MTNNNNNILPFPVLEKEDTLQDSIDKITTYLSLLEEEKKEIIENVISLNRAIIKVTVVMEELKMKMDEENETS